MRARDGEGMKEVSSTGTSSSSANECVCVCVCIVSDVIIVHTNCIEMSSFFIHTQQVGNYTKNI